ncbi:hypothetical protein CEXT_807741 [Caerostris extrusa]|uniref:Uncharacterized protein n=1 Tax=Caerostris extrusa TaxID=172846 RepID=A0AAV4V7X5_CAEEX|nr:hypothetical protein CEXT_807741 [Caerostris extrusa]
MWERYFNWSVFFNVGYKRHNWSHADQNNIKQQMATEVKSVDPFGSQPPNIAPAKMQRAQDNVGGEQSVSSRRLLDLKQGSSSTFMRCKGLARQSWPATRRNSATASQKDLECCSTKTLGISLRKLFIRVLEG